MKGILLISHGPLAEGCIKTLEMFFGENIEQLESLTLSKDQSAENFRELLLKKVESLDTGDGVIVFADLLGGTPCNQSAFISHPNITIIAGMNLAMIMECLGMRFGNNIDISNVLESGKNGIVNFTELLNAKKSGRPRRLNKVEE